MLKGIDLNSNNDVEDWQKVKNSGIQVVINKATEGGNKKMKYIVVSGKGPDERAANYLADYLNCPVMTNDKTFDYSEFENVIGVGDKKEQYTSYLTRLISGADRYVTCQAVLDFIKNGGK